MSIRASTLILWATVATLSACGGGSDTSVEPTPSPSPTPAPTPVSGTSADCINPELSTVGANYVVEQEHSANGTFLQATRLTHTYKPTVRFKDNTAHELLIESEITRAQGQIPVGFKTVFRSFQVTDANSTTLYGGELSLTAGSAPQTQILSYQPPLAVPTSLAVDQVYTQRYTIRTETLTAGVPGSAEQTGTYAVRFLGKESVSVPAGTFLACKLQLPVNAADPDAGSTVQWLVAEGRYRGLPVRADDGAGQVTVATRLMINGS